jgi:hypothetical protein
MLGLVGMPEQIWLVVESVDIPRTLLLAYLIHYFGDKNPLSITLVEEQIPIALDTTHLIPHRLIHTRHSAPIKSNF